MDLQRYSMQGTAGESVFVIMIPVRSKLSSSNCIHCILLVNHFNRCKGDSKIKHKIVTKQTHSEISWKTICIILQQCNILQFEVLSIEIY